MCLLIHHTAEGDLSRNMIADIYQKNGDGFGVAYAEKGKVKTVRTLGGPKEIAAIYEKHVRGREAVLHFRWRTHGEINMANCHPYKVTDQWVLSHNGVLDVKTVRPEMSDTWHLIEFTLRPLMDRDPSLLFQPEFQKMLGRAIGSDNKLGFMHRSGRVVVINRHVGVEARGMWLSNTYAWSAGKFGAVKEKKEYVPFTPTKVAAKQMQRVAA